MTYGGRSFDLEQVGAIRTDETETLLRKRTRSESLGERKRTVGSTPHRYEALRREFWNTPNVNENENDDGGAGGMTMQLNGQLALIRHTGWSKKYELMKPALHKPIFVPRTPTETAANWA